MIDFGAPSARSVVCPRRRKHTLRVRAAWPAVLVTAATLVGGCATSVGSPASVRPEVANPSQAPLAGRPAQIKIRVPRPDYANPASVAASFFVAWASVDSINDGPDSTFVRCAGFVTSALLSQLRTYEVAPAEWQTMRENRLVSTIHVVGVTHPLGAPAPTRTRVYLSINAERVTVTTFGRTESSAGTSVELVRVGRRWLVAQLLYY
jgi:hypothetical protein